MSKILTCKGASLLFESSIQCFPCILLKLWEVLPKFHLIIDIFAFGYTEGLAQDDCMSRLSAHKRWYQLQTDLVVNKHETCWWSQPSKLHTVALKQHNVTLTVTLCLEKLKLNSVRYVTQNSNFCKPGSHFTEQMSSGFPSDVPQLLCLSAAFCPQKQPCAAAAASVCRQPTCCFQEPPWLTEFRQRTSEGKPDDIFSIKYDPVSLKLLFCAAY